MARHSTFLGWRLGLGLAAVALVPGCVYDHWCVDNCASTPKGAIPDPVGTKVNWAIEAQAANAAEDDFVIYRSEWLGDSTELGPFGKYHLLEIAKRLPGVPFPVVIQPSGRPDLDEARRQGLVIVLQMKGIHDADQRVVVVYPKAEGLYGEEAEWIYWKMISPDDHGHGGHHHQQGAYGGLGFGTGSFASRGGGYGRGFGNFGGGFRR